MVKAEQNVHHAVSCHLITKSKLLSTTTDLSSMNADANQATKTFSSCQSACSGLPLIHSHNKAMPTVEIPLSIAEVANVN
jgi:hypothetical protein